MVARRLGCLAERSSRGVQADQGRQRPRRCLNQVHRRGLVLAAFIEDAIGFVGQIGKLLGIGQAGVIMQKVPSFFGSHLIPRKSDLDEETLKGVAEKTGGKYYNAASTDALEKVYKEIDEMERFEIKSSRFYRFHEKFQWLAIPALAFLLLETFLGQTIFRRIP